MASNTMALLCFLHPASAEKKERSYYRSPTSLCTAWTYFTPSQRKNAPHQVLPLQQTTTTSSDLLLGGMEIYTAKSALTKQLEAPFFKEFQAKSKAESLYAAPEELIAFYPVGGFVSRGDLARPFGSGVAVMLALFTAKDEEGAKKLVEILRTFAQWVQENEPGVLTYSVMTRPKAPTEVLMFERYKDFASFKGHGGSKEFRAMFKSTGPYVDGKKTRMCEWTELDNAFVGDVVGGRTAESKL